MLGNKERDILLSFYLQLTSGGHMIVNEADSWDDVDDDLRRQIELLKDGKLLALLGLW